jgi:deazaflavin-dependent oxidoreductase (nitroreductase family)
MAANWNDKTIVEFRANEGRVGGTFEGAPLVLVHHRGRTSGRDYVNPLMYLPDDNHPDTIYVFATKGGLPTNPDWYYNLIAASEGTVERGTDTGDRPRTHRRGARPPLRRTGPALPRLRRLRPANRRRANDPGARAATFLATLPTPADVMEIMPTERLLKG